MSLSVTDIKIITQQAIALSSDAAKLNQQLQQLLNSLVPGERIQAVLDVQTIKQQDIPVLKINDVVVPISKEQVAQLPLTTDRPLEFKVQAVDEQQLKLQLVSPSKSPVAPVNSQPVKVVENSTHDHTRVLKVLQQIHGEISPGTVSEPSSTILSTPTVDKTIPTQAPIQQSQSVETNKSIINETRGIENVTITTKQVQSDASPVKQPTSPDTIVNRSDVRITPEYSQTVITQKDANSPESLSRSPELPHKGAVVSASIEQPVVRSQTNITTPQQSAYIHTESQVRLKHNGPAKKAQEPSAQIREPSAQIREPSAQIREPSAQIREPSAQIREPSAQIREPSAQVREQITQGNTGIQNYIKPRLEVPIEIPNQQQFPILAQSVIVESQRVVQSQSSSLTAQLNKLFAQLDRLNQWHSDNKRQLRSQSGQQLNKASSDIRGGIEELKRYLTKPKQIINQAGVKKAIRHSGSFLEQKQEGARTTSRNSQPSFHQDTKGNLQRLVSATLYHIAKLSVHSQSAAGNPNNPGQPTNQATAQGTSGNTANIPTQTNQKPDLLLKIKQRLHAYGDKSIPQELPRQLLQLLRQILTLSNQSLSQTQLQQLANLRPDNLAPQWFFEIPIFQQDQSEPLQLLIKQEQDDAENQQDKIWTLVLQFDIKQLGKIRAILQWKTEHITIRFLSEHQNTAKLIESELDYVRQIIKDRQLTLNDLEVTQSPLEDLKVSNKGVAYV